MQGQSQEEEPEEQHWSHQPCDHGNEVAQEVVESQILIIGRSVSNNTLILKLFDSLVLNPEVRC
jgi:hypothetical protein